MIKNLLKKNRGIVIADALVAVLIMAIFLGVISILTYNIYITASFTKRNSRAIDYGIKITEYIDTLSYDSVIYGDTTNGLINYINNIDNTISAKKYDDTTILTTPYRVEIKIEKYNELEGNETKQDVIKTVTLTINYNLGNSEKEVTFERVKQR